MNSGFYLRAVFSVAPALAVTAATSWQQRGSTPGKTGVGGWSAGKCFQFICLTLSAWCGTGTAERGVSGLVLAGYGLLTAIDIVFFRIMGQSPGLDILSMGFRERKKMRHYTRGFLRAGDAAVFLLLLLAALLPALFPLPVGGQLAWLWMLCGITGLGMLARAGGKAPRPSGFIHALGRLLRQEIRRPGSRGEKQGAQTLWRHPFPGRVIPGERMNVLMILNESLARNLYGGQGARFMPAVQSFLRDNAENVFDFPLAISNSTASDISYPSIFSGLSPNESWARFEKNPLIWAAAKAAGYSTSLHSAWDLNWGTLDGLMVDGHVDLIVDPQTLNAPLVNYGGMDDRVLVDLAIRQLEATNGPFFSVVACNAQHSPFQVDASLEGHDLKSCQGRYLNSLTILDGCFEKLIGALRRTGQLERTVIFFMSDHGENPSFYENPSRNGGIRSRLDDFSHETLSVPFWVYLPTGNVGAAQRKTLRENQSRIVSNLDYYPTALAAMGIELDAADCESLELGGNDLTQPLPVEREIPCVNTGALRTWMASPVALAAGDELLVYHESVKTFELLAPAISWTTDLWAGAPQEKKETWMKRLADAGLWPAPRHSCGPPEKAALGKDALITPGSARKTRGIQEQLLPVDIFKRRGGARKGKTVTFDLVNAAGHIVFGPNRLCPPGNYEAIFDISFSGSRSGEQTRFVIEVTDQADRFLAQRTLSIEDIAENLTPSILTLPFVITQKESVLELRIFATDFAAGTLHFSGVTLKRSDQPRTD